MRRLVSVRGARGIHSYSSTQSSYPMKSSHLTDTRTTSCFRGGSAATYSLASSGQAGAAAPAGAGAGSGVGGVHALGTVSGVLICSGELSPSLALPAGMCGRRGERELDLSMFSLPPHGKRLVVSDKFLRRLSRKVGRTGLAGAVANSRGESLLSSSLFIAGGAVASTSLSSASATAF